MSETLPEGTAALILRAGAGLANAENRMELEPGAQGAVLAVVPEGWRAQSVEYDLTHMLDRPLSKSGTTYHVLDVPSFVALWAKHATEASEVYASVGSAAGGQDRIVAVLDDHEGAGGDADNRDHRIVLSLRRSPEWSYWLGKNDRLMSQTEFAEHIEGGTAQIVTPDGSTMLKVAEGLHGSRNVEWGSRATRHDGLVTFSYKETGGAQVSDGEVEVPQEFVVRVRPWVGSPLAVDLTAKFRYRLGDRGVQMAYRLLDVDLKQDAAAEEILKDLGAALAPRRDAEPGGEPVVQILRGTP